MMIRTGNGCNLVLFAVCATEADTLCSKVA